jgi:hypothetical protein
MRVIGWFEWVHDAFNVDTVPAQRLRAPHDAGAHQRWCELWVKLNGKGSLAVSQHLVRIMLGVS